MPVEIVGIAENLLEQRRRDLLVRHLDALREAVRVTRRERPFHIDAWGVLPDRMHCVWTRGGPLLEHPIGAAGGAEMLTPRLYKAYPVIR